MASKSKQGTSQTTQSKKKPSSKTSSTRKRSSPKPKQSPKKVSSQKKAPITKKSIAEQKSKALAKPKKQSRLYALSGELTITSIPVILKGGSKGKRFVTPDVATDEKDNAFSKSVLDVSVDGKKIYIMKLDAEQTALLLELLGLIDD